MTHLGTKAAEHAVELWATGAVQQHLPATSRPHEAAVHLILLSGAVRDNNVVRRACGTYAVRGSGLHLVRSSY